MRRGAPAGRRILAALLAAASAAALAACGDVLQDTPIPHNLLESLVITRFPVYWVGASFNGLNITEIAHDPGGAFSIQYGDCLQGGQSTCVTPLRVITSPDNGFIPGQQAAGRAIRLRGVPARVVASGNTVILAAGPVVVDVYAQNPRLAIAAARTLVAINMADSPGTSLPTPLPDTGFGSTQLPGQAPPPLRTLLVKRRPERRVRRRARGARRSSSG